MGYQCDHPAMPANEHADTMTGRPRFDVPVPLDGYRWWYIDGLSDDGRSGIVIIAFVGSVFSPYYFGARSRQPTDPQEHVAINVGLYRPSNKLWAMTERGSGDLARDADSFAVRSSQLRWVRNELHIDIDERSMPLARKLRGRIIVRPTCWNERRFALDAAGRHSWQPVAPVARMEVLFDEPSWCWQGDAYVDTNAGERPLEKDFRSWHWSRSSDDGMTAITYAVDRLDGSERDLAIRFDAEGRCEEFEMPPRVVLPSTGWRIARRANSPSIPAVVRTLEDTPFYARSVLRIAGADGEGRHVMHESLSLTRFCKPWVRFLLPFRMPRIARD
jgi:carotenoid 1,2-hydratase